MAYTPKLSYENSCVLRRIAWSLKEPMPFAINWSIEELASHLDADEICRTCKDNQNAAHVCFMAIDKYALPLYLI